MRLPILLLSTLVLLCSCEVPAPARSLSESELDRWVPGLLRASGVAGLSLAVLEKGNITLALGYGVKEEGTAEGVSSRTVFEAASLSKPVFAYGVLLLARDGKLDLDRPLTAFTETAYLPGDPRLQRITSRMVLAHSTGFPNWRPGRWTDEPKPLTIDFDPGTSFGYSGEGYEYLRHVVERITAVPIEDYLQETVLRPLGMSQSSFVWRDAYDETAATGHDRGGKPAAKWRPREPNVAGSLHTTAEDYARFLKAILGPDAAEIMAQMTTRETTIDEALGWGLGLGLESSKAGELFWHWGDNDSFKAFVMGSRKDRSAVVLLTNSENGLRACQAVVRAAFGSDHPALEFRMLQY